MNPDTRPETSREIRPELGPDTSTAYEREFWNRQHGDAPASPPARPIAPAFAPRAPSLVERMRDRLHDWRSDARVGVVVLVVIAVVAGVVWYRIGISDGGDAGAAAPRARSSDPTTAPGARETHPTAATAAKAGHIAVHVAGAVARPGVVELPAGSRVIDAVEAVGGAPADADLDRLNLAAKVVDGQRIFVPKAGQADPGVAGDGGGSGSAGASGAGTGGALPGGKLNLNTATQAQLEALPGIGPTYAQAIIAERERRGGFKSVNELRSVRGIGDKRFAEIAPLVTV
jgi:competence protein ComEA